MKRAFAAVAALFLIGLLALPQVEGAKKPRTGEIKENRYQDLRFGFALQLPQEWKMAKPKKEYTPQRLVAEQKNPRIPMKLRSDPGWAVTPTVMVFADSTDMAAGEFFTFLQSDSGKTELKDKILSKSILLAPVAKHDVNIQTRTSAEIGGREALKLKAKLEYEALISGRSGATLIRDYRVGHIYIIPLEGWLLYVELVCENQFFPSLHETFEKIMASLTFADTESDTTAGEGEGSKEEK